MALAHTEAQKNNLEETSTRPITILQLEHSGAIEYLSCSGVVQMDSILYSAGTASVRNIEAGRSAVITVPATATRVAETINNTWRGGICKIYAIPALPDDDAEFVLADAIFQLDGLILNSKWQGSSVTITAIQKNLDGNFTPRNRIDEYTNHVPAPGTILAWEGDTLVLVSRE